MKEIKFTVKALIALAIFMHSASAFSMSCRKLLSFHSESGNVEASEVVFFSGPNRDIEVNLIDAVMSLNSLSMLWDRNPSDLSDVALLDILRLIRAVLKSPGLPFSLDRHEVKSYLDMSDAILDHIIFLVRTNQSKFLKTGFMDQVVFFLGHSAFLDKDHRQLNRAQEVVDQFFTTRGASRNPEHQRLSAEIARRRLLL